RWRRLAETRTLNTGRLLTDLIDELGAVHDDALAFAHAGRNEDAGGIEGLGPDGARLEQLSFHVPPDDALAVAAADDGVTAHNDPVRGLPALRGDGDRLTGPDRGRRRRNGELQHSGLLLKRSAPSFEAEFQGDVCRTNRGCVLQGCRIAVAVVVGLDPQRVRVDNLKQNVLGLYHLAGYDA